MSLLSYNELVKLVEDGVINAPEENVNGSSIDLTLDNVIRVETKGDYLPVDLMAKESINTHEYVMGDDGYVLMPGEFILASSREIFNLPDDICAEFKLKSTQARNALQHCLAGHCDQGWSNSKLTLEFYNTSRYHPLILKPKMKCGQIIFHKTTPVPGHANYAVTGQYNYQDSVTSSKGLR